MKSILPFQMLFFLVLTSPLFGDGPAPWVGTYRPSRAWIQAQRLQRSRNNQIAQTEGLSKVSVSLRPNMTFDVRLPIGDLAGTLAIDGVDSAGYVGLSLTVAPAADGSPAKVLNASYKNGALFLKAPFGIIALEKTETKQEKQ